MQLCTKTVATSLLLIAVSATPALADKHMTLLVDRSGSMSWTRSGSTNSRWADAYTMAQQDLLDFALSTADTTFYTVASFDGNRDYVVHADSVDLFDGLLAVDALFMGTSPGGLTPLADAVCQSAIDLFFDCVACPYTDRLLLVYSDGDDTSSTGGCSGPSSNTTSLDCTGYPAGTWQNKVCAAIDPNPPNSSPTALVLVRHWDSIQLTSTFAQSLLSFANTTGGAYAFIADSDANYPGAEDAVSHILLGGGSTDVGSNYCMQNTNSTGQIASMSGQGSASVAENDLTLQCSSMPADALSMFLVSSTQGFVANPGGSAGNACLGGSIGRYQMAVQNSGVAGAVSLVINLHALPQPTGFASVQVGETWNFQCWFRDSVGGVATSNFSDGLTVPFI